MKKKFLVNLVLILFFSLNIFCDVVLLSENFSGCTNGTHSSPSTSEITNFDAKMQTPGWTGSYVYEAGGEVKLGKSSNGQGSITTPTINASGNGGNFTLSFDLCKFGGDNTIVQVFHASNGTNFIQVGGDITAPVSFTTQTLNITGGTANSKIKIAAKTNSSCRFYLDNILVTQVISEPTLAASNITFQNVTTNSLTINWTNGNGEKRIVLAKAGSAVDAVPTDGVTYTANSVFSNGQQIGSGNYVVYNGNSNTVNITGLNANTTYYFAIFEYNGSAGNENYKVDSYPTSNVTTSAGGNDNNSKADNIGITQPDPVLISSLIDTEAEAVKVLEFNLKDLGTSDLLPTKVTKIRIKTGTNNTADWTDNIQGIKLYDETNSSNITISSVNITDAYIDINIDSGNLEIPNNSTKKISFWIYLNTSNIVDNSLLEFKIARTDHGFTADGSGSSFADDFGADIISNQMLIDVVATKLLFNQIPTEILINTDFTVSIKATDANGNIDKDNNSLVTITKNSGNGTLSTASGFSLNLVNGEKSWTDLRYNKGDIFTLSISGGGLTPKTSDNISAYLINEGFESGLCPPAGGWTQNDTYVNSTAPHSGTRMLGMNGVNDWVATPLVNDPGILTFWAKTSSGTANFTIKIQVSSDGTNWTDKLVLVANGSNTGDITDTYVQKTVNLNLTGNYYIKWIMTARSGGSFYLDDIKLNNSTPITIVQFASTSATINENSGTYNLVISISNPSVTNATSADIVLISGNSADIGNYSTQNITFPANSSANKIVTLNITDDSFVESSENFIFQIQNVTGGDNAQIGSQNQFTLTIQDNDVANTDSYVHETGIIQPSGSNISSLADTPAEAVKVLKFKISDKASGDGLPTIVTNVRIKPGDLNTADWTDNIAGVKLYNETNSSDITIGTATITDNYIDIPITANNLTIPDGENKEISFAIYLKNSNISDNACLQFKIDSNNHGFTADTNGSGFATNFSAVINSNSFNIEVIATKLLFVQQPTNVIQGEIMTPSVTVKACDVNENIDKDFTNNITITASGAILTNSPISVAAIAGISTFNNLTFSSSNNNVTLTATSGALNQAVSNSFNVIQPTVATPTFDLAQGTYYSNKTVTISCATNGALIYYTLDGTDPTESSNLYTAPIIIKETATLKAKAYKLNYQPSNINSATYTLRHLSITSLSNTYTENFNSMGTSSTANIPFPFGIQTGDGLTLDLQTTQQASSGAPSAGGTYNWGQNGTTDRALGFMFSSSYSGKNILLAVTNNTGSNINSVTIGFDYEQYRKNTSSQIFKMQYSNNMNSNWQDITGASFTNMLTGTSTYDFTNLIASQKINLTFVLPTPLENGNTIYFRWNFSGSSSSNGVGIDNFSISANTILGTCEDPIISHTTGTYYGTQQVSLSCNTPSAEIRYTLNGSEPTLASNLYTAPLEISTNTTIKAKAFKNNYQPSNVSTSQLTIKILKLTSPNGAENWDINSNQNITWTSYGLDGTTINILLYKNDTFYKTIANNIQIGNNSYNWNITSDIEPGNNYKIKIINNNDNNAFDMSDNNFSLRNYVSNPIFNVEEGTYYSNQTISISCSTDNALIYYTLDNSEPNESSLLYTTPITIKSSTIIKAKAFKANYQPSLTITKNYEIRHFSINELNVNYQENFDSMSSNSSAVIPNPFGIQTGNTQTIDKTTTFQASSGTPTTGGTYNWGQNGTSDRALGFMFSSGYNNKNIIFAVTNNTNSNILSFSLTFDYEQYRRNTSNQVFKLQYSESMTSNWVDVNGGEFSNISIGSSLYDFNNLIAKQTKNILFVPPTPVTPGNTVYFRFTLNGTSNSAGVGIDNFRISGTNLQGQLPAPIMSISSGTYYSMKTVTISCNEANATIKYTLDGSEPNETSLTYTNPLNISSNTTIKAKAYKNGWEPSQITTENYIFKILNLTNPNGLETWDAGNTYNIVWNYYNLNGNIKIDLYQNNSFITTIATDIPINNLIYSWNIPADFNPGNYKIKIISLNDNNAFDLSENEFFIQNKVSTPVISLGSGIYFSIQQVSLSTATPNAEIHYTLDGSEPTLASNIYTSPIFISESKTLKAKAFKNGWLPSNTSSESYIIKMVNILSPNGSEIYQAGNNVEIKWNYFGISGNINIILTNSEQNFIQYICENYDITTLKYNWIIPQNIIPGNYKIKIISLANNAVQDFSDNYFSIVNRVSDPIINKSSGIYYSDQIVEITCSTVGAEIRYTLDGTEPNDNSLLYNSPILVSNPTTIKAKAFKLGYYPSNTVNSEIIIKKINIISPNMNSIFYGNENCNISWSSVGLNENLLIELYSNNNLINIISNSINSSNTSFIWNIPVNIEPNRYKIKISSLTDNNLFTFSEEFFINNKVSNPIFSLNSGIYYSSQNVSISCSTPGAVIRYTLNGDEPNENSSIYLNPLQIETSSVLKVKAFKNGWISSNTVSSIYTIRKLEVINPNTNEQYQAGNTLQIKWNYSGISGNVKIDLYLNNSFLQNIANIIPISIKSYEWEIPININPGSGYKIKITSLDDNNCFDYSDNSFVIKNKVQTPFASIISNTYNAPQYVYLFCNTQNAEIRYTLDGSIPTINSQLYNTNPIIINNSLTLKAKAFKNGWEASDIFEANYIIKYINILYPNGNEIFNAGNQCNISWYSTGLSGNIKIDLIKDNSILLNIIDNLPINALNYNWLIPQNIQPGNYKIKISSKNETNIYDLSNYDFTIQNTVDTPIFNISSGTYYENKTIEITCNTPGATIRYTLDGTEPNINSNIYVNPILINESKVIKAKAFKNGWLPSNTSSATYIIKNLKIINPNGYETIHAGNNLLINWSYAELSGNIKLELYKNNDFYLLIANNIALNNNSYLWNIPSNMEPGNYKIKITSLDDLNAYDFSDNTFSIQNTLNMPNVNLESGVYYSTQNIILTTSISGANIRYTLDGTEPTINSDLYTNPIIINESKVLKAKAFKNGWLESPTLTKNYTIKEIKLLSPNGSEQYHAGNILTINWNYTGIDGLIKIELINSDLIVTNIIENLNISLKNYSWTIPNDFNPGNYKIKITSLSDPNAYAISEQYFSIGNTVACPYFNIDPAQNYYNTQIVKIFCPTNGAIIRYTLNGQEPNENSAIFDENNPIILTHSTMIKAKAYKNGWTPSVTITGDFKIIFIKITEPNEAKTFCYGENRLIKWDYSGISGNVKIELYQNNTSKYIITQNTSVNNKSYNWLIPTDLNFEGEYYIKISSLNANIEDISLFPINFDISYDLAAEKLTDNQTELAGRKARYLVKIANNGYYPDNLSININHSKTPGWTAVLRDINDNIVSNIISLNGNEEKLFYFDVYIPNLANDNEIHKFNLKIQSLNYNNSLFYGNIISELSFITTAKKPIFVTKNNPFFESFEENTFPPLYWCEGISTVDGELFNVENSSWNRNNNQSYVFDGNYSAISTDNQKYNWLITPYISLKNINNTSKGLLSFKLFSNQLNENDAKFKVLIYNGNEWNLLKEYSSQQLNNEELLDLTNYKGLNYFRLAFVSKNNNNSCIAIDKIKIIEKYLFDFTVQSSELNSNNSEVSAGKFKDYNFIIKNEGCNADNYFITHLENKNLNHWDIRYIVDNNEISGAINILPGYSKNITIRISPKSGMNEPIYNEMLDLILNISSENSSINYSYNIKLRYNRKIVVTENTPYLEDFENSYIPTGWHQAISSDIINSDYSLTENIWGINANTQYVFSGNRSLKLMNTENVNYKWLLSPVFDLSGNVNYAKVDFKCYFDKINENDKIFLMAFNGINWQKVKEIQCSNLYSTTEEINLSMYKSDSTRFAIVTSPTVNVFAIDNAKLTVNAAFQSISLSTNDLNFGEVYINEFKDMNVIITSNGNIPLEITNIVVPLGFNVEFVSKSDNNSEFGKGNIYIQPGESKILRVRFLPLETIIYNNELIINCGAVNSPIKIKLYGKGVLPNLDLGNNIVDFGIKEINSFSTSNLILRNTGTGLLKINKINIKNDNSKAFSCEAILPLSINAGDSILLPITFNPKVYDEIQADMEITTNTLQVKNIILKGISIHKNSAPKIVLNQFSMKYFTGEAFADSGQTITLAGKIIDNWGPAVIRSNLYYKKIGDNNYSMIQGVFTEKETPNDVKDITWIIPADKVTSPGLEVYFDATDGIETSYYPNNNYLNNPFTISVNNLPPQIIDIEYNEYQVNGNINIQINASDSDGIITKIIAYYRIIGSSVPYDSVIIYQTKNNNIYEFSLNNLPENGIEYYIVVKDNSGISTYYGTPDTPKTILPSYMIKQGWNMISIPYRVNQTASEIFSPYFKFYYGWNESSNIWTLPVNISSGKGYIAYAENSSSDSIRFMTEGTPNTDNFNLPLSYTGNNGNFYSTGWNLIGNPYEKPISLYNNIILNNVEEKFWWWNPETNEYMYYPNGGIFEPVIPAWRGVWVHAKNNNPSIEFIYSNKNRGSNIVKNEKIDNKLQIKVKSGNIKDSYTFIAINNNSSIDFDNYDMPKLTPITGKYLYSYILQQNGNQYDGKYAFSVCPENDIIKWNLVVETNLDNKEITMQFINTELFAQGYDLYLKDLQNNNIYNLRECDKISFESGSCKGFDDNICLNNPMFERKNGNYFYFEISAIKNLTDIGNNKYSFKLYQNIPNPFNPTTTINYEIPEDENITLKVYNVKGELIKTLIDKKQFAGKYSIIWDGKDERGNNVASGIYFYKLKCGSKEITNKMLLLK